MSTPEGPDRDNVVALAATLQAHGIEVWYEAPVGAPVPVKGPTTRLAVSSHGRFWLVDVTPLAVFEEDADEAAVQRAWAEERDEAEEAFNAALGREE